MAGITPEIEALLVALATEWHYVFEASREESAWRDEENPTGSRKFSRESLIGVKDADAFAEKYPAARRRYPQDTMMLERLEALRDARHEMFGRVISYYGGIGNDMGVAAALVEVDRRLRHVRDRAIDLIDIPPKESNAEGIPPVKLNKEAMAVAFVYQLGDPNVTYDQIADAIGTTREYIKQPRHKKLRAALEVVKTQQRTGTVRNGWKDTETGYEAEGDADLDYDEIDNRIDQSEKI